MKVRMIIYMALALMFMAFAFVQLNDPDPILWIVIYGACAVVCVMAAFDYFIFRLLLAMAVVYVGVAATLFGSVIVWLRSADRALLFDDIAKMQYPYIEESREFLGLMICLAVVGSCWARARTIKR